MSSPLSPTSTLSLAGPWHVSLDPTDTGIANRWFDKPLPLTDPATTTNVATATTITLPGDLTTHGLGDTVTPDTPWIGSIFDRSYFTDPEYAPYRKPGNIKLPFWLQPEKYYAGAAWYQRDLELPADWTGRRIVLSLERAHWETRAWLDGRELGRNDSLCTPHEYDLGTALTPGRHTLTLRVDNRYLIPIGQNSHSISDHTQGNWNGLIGRLELRATAPSWIDDLQIYPRVATRSVRIKGRVGGLTPTGGIVTGLLITGGTTPSSSAPAAAATIRLTSPSGAPAEITLAKDGTFETEYALRPDAALWDEFTPALHTLTATLPSGEAHTVTFGLREIAAEGTQFTLNGRKIFLRGTLECAIFPKTGHPPTDVESWKRLLRIARAHGLNHLRFHSWCPPQAAFVAGDELGFYFQIEAASWPNQGATVGNGCDNDAWTIRETDRILRIYGNHACFILMAAGNEPDGAHKESWLAYWVDRVKTLDTRRLYTCGAGWPEIPQNQYQLTHHPRMHQWADNLRSRINALPPATQADYRGFISARRMPVVSHEIGEWCVYPNFDEIEKYTGYLKAKNLEIFRDALAAKGLADQARAFLHASGKLQALCYKEEIESALRTPGMGGIHLLDLHDFPGQGTALVGVLDAFWEEKGYITPAEYRRFAGPTVPLARLAKRVFTAGEILEAELEVAHYGERLLTDAVATWKLVTTSAEAVGNDTKSTGSRVRAALGTVLAEGRLSVATIPFGSAIPLGRIAIPLDRITGPVSAKLVVELSGTDAANDWDVWIYPRELLALCDAATLAAPHRPPAQPIASTPATQPTTPTADQPTPCTDVHFADQLDAATLAALESGATVFLSIPPARVAPDPKRGKVELGFSSIFWNTAWTTGQAPHTLGILCDPAHAAFAQFPTEAHSNWQWWYPVMSAGAMILDGLPRELRPVVQVIDDWFTNRKLGLVFEAKLGRGKLLVTSIDLGRNDNPVTRQLRTSLLAYVSSAAFAPSITITPEQVHALSR